MRKIPIVIVFIFTTVQAFTQQSINFGIIYGQRLNYREYVFKRVIGTSIEYTLPLLNKVDIRFSAGIEGTDAGLGKVFESYDDYMVIPLKAGVQPYIYEDRAFLFAESGLRSKAFHSMKQEKSIAQLACPIHWVEAINSL